MLTYKELLEDLKTLSEEELQKPAQVFKLDKGYTYDATCLVKRNFTHGREIYILLDQAQV